ncbi:hypothetical protein PLICRDRAFT_99416 [Plicaturopsis crispa FD-325 SS-3]|nr:hypothetical protein PLICRDRAFT_99416 [Plicaturopsis crispa FD-325 SS-3]
MTSSLRNSLHRRNHKERSQLASRSKLGILEKHADYVQRARDYHSKQDRLTRLQQKAAERNKDEFYFSMTKEGTQGGVHVKDRGNQSLPTDIVKILKTQDENYVRTMRTAGLKKIDKIKSQLMTLADLIRPIASKDEDGGDEEEGLDEEELEILRDAGVISAPKGKRKARNSRKPTHIVFVDSKDDARKYAQEKRKSSSGVNEDVDMDATTETPLDLGWKLPDEKKKGKKRRTDAQSEHTQQDAEELEEERKASALVSPSPPTCHPTTHPPTRRNQHHRKHLLKELSARLFRDTQLRYAERELEMQRLMMGKGGRQKLRGAEKVEGSDDDGDETDEDELDARGGRASKSGSGSKGVDEKTWKPRVYKWKIERKR